MLTDRLLESAGVLDYAEVVIVLNLDAPDLAHAAGASGLRWVHLRDYEADPADRLLLGVLRPGTKKKVIHEFLLKHPGSEAAFRPAIHSFTSISRTAALGTGVFAEPGVVVAPHAMIGDFASINRNCSIGHHARIGAWSMINPGVNIAGRCDIGEGVSIGIGVNVFDGVGIGPGSVIGGGSVVMKDIPPGVVAYGNPCQTIRDA